MVKLRVPVLMVLVFAVPTGTVRLRRLSGFAVLVSRLWIHDSGFAVPNSWFRACGYGFRGRGFEFAVLASQFPQPRFWLNDGKAQFSR